MAAQSAKKKIWGWMMFDWASQPFHTLLITFIFAPYFASTVIGDGIAGQIYWGYMLSAASIVIILLAPVLGAVADSSGPRKPWIAAFSVLYFVGAFCLWWAVPEMNSVTMILLAFGTGMIGMEFATIFTNAMMPDLGPREEIGRISGSGWAFGYWGGVLALALMLLFLAENAAGVTLLGGAPLFGLDPDMREGTRSVGPLTAVWFAVFMIPFFLWVPDVTKRKRQKGVVRKGLIELSATLKGLPSRVSFSAYLGASMFYRDALAGMFAFGGIYAGGVLGWSITQIGVFGIVAAISGAVFAWLGGFADKKYGPKPVIVVCILILIVVCSVIVTTSREMALGFPLEAGSNAPDIIFFICGAFIGAAGGAIQAASRTMLIHQSNPARMTEAFGLYALSGKATAFLAPFFIALTTDITNSQRMGVTPLIGLFVVGLILLIWVKPGGESEA